MLNQKCCFPYRVKDFMKIIYMGGRIKRVYGLTATITATEIKQLGCLLKCDLKVINGDVKIKSDIIVYRLPGIKQRAKILLDLYKTNKKILVFIQNINDGENIMEAMKDLDDNLYNVTKLTHRDEYFNFQKFKVGLEIVQMLFTYNSHCKHDLC
jgi:hypothetical protein